MARSEHTDCGVSNPSAEAEACVQPCCSRRSSLAPNTHQHLCSTRGQGGSPQASRNAGASRPSGVHVSPPTAGGSHEDALKPKKKQRAFDWSRARLQRVLLKIAYNGENYAGLAAQADDSDVVTVESVIFKAMERACLIPSRNFSRCGRTDKGVHAAGNYISLNMRILDKAPQQQEKGGCCGAYVSLLNRLLPPDIRILAATPVPPTFDARFDCMFRLYKYYFETAGLDIQLMQTAARQFIGLHNFLRFCKIDKKQDRNLWRRILRFEIETQGEGFAVATIVGVRFMMAALLEVGRGTRPISFISSLLREGKDADAAREHSGGGRAIAGSESTRTDDRDHGKKSCGGERALHPAPACSLVLYDCCFEGLYFQRNGVINRLNSGSKSASLQVLRETKQPTTDQQSHGLDAQNSKTAAPKWIGNDKGKRPSCLQLTQTPGCTEESRSFQVVLRNIRRNTLVLRVDC
ncbi:tRNA pseudouridine synthase related protein [Cyclospora cayetanensis]|uniref:tRNA pseudouridine synthase n=1 Tax=Cyclospora cayetanensis TaxID=88456 RepID=A0A1D3D202_9EIME|nr:tRNA pseudouridine synthase related protein [Cyclospora cayetanensis]